MHPSLSLPGSWTSTADSSLSFVLHYLLTFAFLRHRCDEIKLDGSRKLPTEKRGSYIYAQKMHASMTYAFGRIQGLGSQTWHKSEISGRMIGNPSVSESVSTYMMSLKNRKVCRIIYDTYIKK